jgi:cell division protein FtsW (lipid II flippase)
MPASDPAHRKMALSETHKNIAIGNRFRLEAVKHMISLGVGAIVFTVTFRKDFQGISDESWLILIGLGWIALLVSVCGGVVQLKWWEKFYLSYRKDFKGKGAEGTAQRDRYLTVLRISFFFQSAGLVLGLLLLALYCFLAMMS